MGREQLEAVVTGVTVGIAGGALVALAAFALWAAGVFRG